MMVLNRRFLILSLLVPSFTRCSLASAAEDDGYGDFGTDKHCPNYRCSGGLSAVPKTRVKFSSVGCSSMGGGVMMTGMGGMGGGKEVYAPCCDLFNACYQTCGSSKKSCDDSFNTCTKQMCGLDDSCTKSAELNTMMLSFGGCTKFDQAQYAACNCVPKDVVEEKRADAIRYFYKKYSPSTASYEEKANQLAKKADSAGKMAGLIKKLLIKYPNAITKTEDPQQAMYKKMMEEGMDKDRNNDKTKVEDTETEGNQDESDETQEL